MEYITPGGVFRHARATPNGLPVPGDLPVPGGLSNVHRLPDQRGSGNPAAQKAHTGYGITVSISVAGISFDMQWAEPTG